MLLFFIACPYCGKNGQSPIEYTIYGEVMAGKILLHIEENQNGWRPECMSKLVAATQFEVWISDKSPDSLGAKETFSFTDKYEIGDLQNQKTYYIALKRITPNFAPKMTNTIQVIPNLLNPTLLHNLDIRIPCDSPEIIDKIGWNKNLNYVSYHQYRYVNAHKDTADNFLMLLDVANRQNKQVARGNVRFTDWNEANNTLLFATHEKLFDFHPTTGDSHTLLAESSIQYLSPHMSIDGESIYYVRYSSSASARLFHCNEEGYNPSYLKDMEYGNKFSIVPHHSQPTQLYIQRAKGHNEGDGIYLLNISTLSETEIISPSPFKHLSLVDVSPDANKLAIANDWSGKTTIWIYDIAAAKWSQTNLTDSDVQFSADGNALVFFQRKNAQEYALYRLEM